MNLPPEPGLNRRLAYSNIIRMRNNRNSNRNLNINFSDTVNGTNIFYHYHNKELSGLHLNELFRNSSVLLYNNNFECPICQEETDLNIIRKLKCDHRFHIYCIEKWLSKETTCPICRKDLSN